MYLSLLECVYDVKDRERVEAWLIQANLGGVLICTIQYDEEILAVLASRYRLLEALQKICRQPAISSCEEKCANVFRVTTTVAPEQVIRSFPFREKEEWYQGIGQAAYLCLQTPQFAYEQLVWLASSRYILAWDSTYALIPVPVGGKVFQHT